MKILITGDFVISKSYGTGKIDDSVRNLFSDSNYNIINLEAPVTTSSTRILKTGPNLRSEQKSTLDVLKALNTHLVTLANNHILDYDQQGVKDTLVFCSEHNIKTVGGGMNLQEASEVHYIDDAEGRIAIVNFSENEWTCATDDSAGANPMDIVDNANQIMEARKNADYVFVIIHGGHEYYNLPSPRMQKQYRFYAQQGADLIIGHHTHCVNGNEVFQGVPIYYSLGNFLFTHDSSYEDWYTGLILEISINKKRIETRLHPVQQSKTDFAIKLISGDEKKTIMERIDGLNTIISSQSKLKKKWNEYVQSKSKTYLNYWSLLSFIQNRYLKSALLRINVSMFNKKGLRLYLNLMRCESHYDLSKEVIRKYLYK